MCHRGTTVPQLLRNQENSFKNCLGISLDQSYRTQRKEQKNEKYKSIALVDLYKLYKNWPGLRHPTCEKK
jgi:hypothetical protein